MSGSAPVLLLLMLASSSWAAHFLGGTMTFNPKGTNPDGSYKVILRYKYALVRSRCSESPGSWKCDSGNCGSQTSLFSEIVDQESGGDWCQKEGVMTRHISSNLPFELELASGNWIPNVMGIDGWQLRTAVDLGNRSDTREANRSPQTTVIPLLYVPVNCPRNVSLLSYDPDGDRVECRFALEEKQECDRCPLPNPNIFTLNSTSCTLDISPSSGSVGNTYLLQLQMEDFPSQTIVLTYSDGSQSVRNYTIPPLGNDTVHPLSRLPVQFAVRVGASVPSCTEGLHLPKFLPPTPANGAQLYVSVNQTLEINVTAQAISVTDLLFTGPHNVNETSTANGTFTLRWTPSQDEDGETHPLCFIAQATVSGSKYHSELRCVIIIVGHPPPPSGYVVGLEAGLSSEEELTEASIRSVVLHQLKEELIRLGVPADFTIRVKKTKQTGP